MRIKEGFVIREVAGQIVAVATGEAGENFQGMIRLNETGRDIWQGLMDGLSEQKIAEKLAETYEIPVGQARKDTRGLLEQMEEAGFLTA